MEKKLKPFDETTIISTPKPFAASTEEKKQFRSNRDETMNDTSDKTSDSDESLGIISIKSEDFGPFIDNLQLKEAKSNTSLFAKEQRELASQTLQKRESRVFGLPSRLLRPSEISNTSDSCISIENGSTISESDLLWHTSNQRSSILPHRESSKIDIAESIAKLSLEIRNPSMSLSAALQKLQEEYQKVRDSISIKSDMFKPAEEAESLLLADEASWRRDRGLPADNVDFTLDNFDASKSSISAFFKQRCEDISNIIPSSTRKCSMASDVSNFMPSNSRKSSISSIPGSISSVPEVSSSESGSNDETPQRESLSITKIAKILQNSQETPNKVLDYLMKQCKADPTDNLKQTSTSPNAYLKKDYNFDVYSPIGSDKREKDRGNSHPSTSSSNKENYDSINIPPTNLFKMSHSSKSLSSLRSTSSLSNLPGGKLPIETTHCELVWGCVKVGKSDLKQFTLRNRSSNRLRIQCSISSPLFRMMLDRAEDSSNSLTLKLHPHETKSISVVFNPLTEGAVADEILFSPCDPNLQQTKKQSIKLFGYGGVSTVEFRNKVLRDSISRYALNLGNIFGQPVISESVKIFNRGTLSAFIFIDYVPKTVALSKVVINPNVLIMGPNEDRDIVITFKPNREDMRYLEHCMSTSTFEIGLIKMISGPEPIRGRIKRLCKLAMERKLELDNLCCRLQLEIPGEDIPGDIVKCRESVSSIKSLLQGLIQREVVIILEKDIDTTLVHSMTDEDSLFQSLHQQSTVVELPLKSACKLEPASVILTPPSKLQDWLFIISESAVSLYFKIDVPEGLEVNPSFGHISPGSTRAVKLRIKKLEDITQSVFSVSVSVGDEMLYFNVKIISI